MLNCVSVIASLKDVDNEIKEIRYGLVRRVYEIYDDKLVGDLIPFVNWNKEKYGELFSFKNNSLVAIKGRVENYSNKTVIVVESIVYLGLKDD